MSIELLCHTLIGGAIEVHRALGPGLLESLYRKCLAIELRSRGLLVREEVPIPIQYKGQRLEPGYRIDLLVEKKVIVEVKSVVRLEPVFKAQLLTYLKLTNLHIGYLLNFNNQVLKDGITRMVR